MGNKKKGRRGEVQQEEEGYLSEASIQSSQASGVSVASSSGKKSKRGSSSPVASPPEVVDIADVFKDAIGDLEEKRGTVRISALGRLAKALTTTFLDEVLEGQVDELIPLLQGSLKKGGTEAEWASKVLALVWITAGPHDAYTQLASFFSRSLKDVDVEIRPALIIAYSVIAFIEDLDDEDMRLILKEFMTLIGAETDGPLIVNALSAFALLYSKLSSETEDDDLTDLLDTHRRLLEHSSVEVRIVAGENIALLLEGLDDDEEDGFVYEHMDDLLESVKILATDSTRHRAKADRASQRTAYRDILSSIETREPPSIPMTIRNQSVYFDSWAKVKQWAALKLVAGEGLDVHASENVRIAGLFDLSMDNFGARGSMNLRHHDTTVGKSRAKGKKQERVRRAADLGAEDAEDFV